MPEVNLDSAPTSSQAQGQKRSRTTTSDTCVRGAKEYKRRKRHEKGKQVRAQVDIRDTLGTSFQPVVRRWVTQVGVAPVADSAVVQTMQQLAHSPECSPGTQRCLAWIQSLKAEVAGWCLESLPTTSECLKVNYSLPHMVLVIDTSSRRWLKGASELSMPE